MNRLRWLPLALLTPGLAAWAASCSSDETTQAAVPTVPTGGAGGAIGGGSGTAGFTLGGGSPGGCETSEDCDGGVCVDHVCCASAAQVCGTACCGDEQVCLFEQCLVPGDACVTEADCPDGYYCEPALGEPVDGGAGGSAPDASCTQPLPNAGRCVPKPPICGDGEDPPGCIEPCEYHPPEGQLTAVRKWQWGYDPVPTQYPNFADVWSSPTVARIYDANCDGNVDLADPPNIVFVSGNAKNTCCSCSGDAVSTCLTGVLRMLDGSSGREIWSLAAPDATSVGFAGMSVAVGDVDGDERLDIVAMTGEGRIALIDSQGVVQRISEQRVDGYTVGSFGWGGGIALGDMDGDGHPEIAFGRTLFDTLDNAITRLWIGDAGSGGALSQAVTHFADLDLDGDLELLAGRTAYHRDGSHLWSNAAADGFTAVGDFDDDATPEVVVVAGGALRVLHGFDGSAYLGPLTLPGTGSGGPPTVADFDGDGTPEIGVAQQNLYSMIKPNFTDMTLDVIWSQTNHDMSSAVTGSSVFDFEGDGKAEVVYNDECYLWVYDGTNGDILFTGFTQSFTATESSIVADVDGDGHAEMVQVANGASPTNWTCAHHNAEGVIVAPHTQPFPVWQPPVGGPHYRGITVLGDAANSWVGTRTLWNQHAYSVSNVCDPRDGACVAGSYYGQIPPQELPNWQQPWLNNFRQNVQDQGLFDAPDAVVSLSVECVTPVAMTVSVRNAGLSGLPADVEVEILRQGTPAAVLGTVATTHPLLSGQTELLEFEAPAGQASTSDTFFARIVSSDPPSFHECRDDNNESASVAPQCVQ